MYNVTVPLNSQLGNFSISGKVSAYSVPDVPVEGFSEVTITYPPSEVDFSVSSGGEGSEGGSGDKFNNPWGVSVDNVNGICFVADRGNHCIRTFSI